MSSFINSFLALSCILAASTAFPSLGLTLDTRTTPSSSTPLPPSQDPFHTPPANYASAKPGAILRMRNALGNLANVVGDCSAAFNILYRTTDSLYNPSWAVTTLYVPPTFNASNSTHGQALLSYQYPYDSADIEASPSYAFNAGAPADIPVALGRGWYVSVPDYEGPLASFSAGVQSGHAKIDSIRAVLSSSESHGLAPCARYALWGFSGGTLASEWAAELQVQYAPELNFAGVALGGLTPNGTRVIKAVTERPFAGLIPNILLGVTSQYPKARDSLLRSLKTTSPYNQTTFLSALNMSSFQSIALFANHSISSYFDDSLNATLQTPILAQTLNREAQMGYHGVLQMPLFVYKAIADELSPIEDTDKLVDRYCAVGANILYQRNRVGGHLAEDVNGDARAFSWLGSVLDGTYTEMYRSQGCMIQNVTINVTSSPI